MKKEKISCFILTGINESNLNLFDIFECGVSKKDHHHIQDVVYFINFKNVFGVRLRNR